MLPDAVRARLHVQPLIDLLGGGNFTRIVGGAVRDGLLGLPVSDIDLATRLLPGEVLRRLRANAIKGVPTGLAHGTVTAITAAGPIEITTLRRDVATDGRHAVVAFADDWVEDAARRDFTINALYADAASGTVFDYFGGIADLDARRVRFIGDPSTRIAEDHLRILRFFRFQARFGGRVADAASLGACAARANDLMALSRERIAGELLKLLVVVDPVPTIATMLAHHILRPVLPEIVGVDVLAALTATELRYAVGGDAIRRLAALLPPDAGAAQTIAARLRLSNADAKRLAVLAARPVDAPGALAYRHGVGVARDLVLLGGRDPAIVGAIPARLSIKGRDLIARGLKPGPIVAATLRQIEDAWISGDFPDGVAFERIVDRALDQARTGAPQT